MIPLFNSDHLLDRRKFLNLGARGMGALGLASLAQPGLLNAAGRQGGALGDPHFMPKAKRVIYLFFSGGPSHIDMYDYKPGIRKVHGIELPESIRQGQRITGMTSGQKSFPCVAPMFEFKQHGQSGAYYSEILPHIASLADEMTLIRSVNTEAINHDPAITYINTGTQQLGHPSMGAWLNYGLGSPSDNLPGYIVMISKGRGGSQALYSRLWGSGFLPSKHQGVKFRSSGEPVLFLNNPPGINRNSRRAILDSIKAVNEAKFAETRDAEIQARIAQYEMAFRMQASVPELTDLKSEPNHVFDLYGKDSKKPGKYAYNCILARRMLESGVPFVQLFHRGWDQHGNCPRDVRYQCEDVDQPTAALVKDLKQRGMLEDTLVTFTTEFGRTPFTQSPSNKVGLGRDHNGPGFTVWMAGAGLRPGIAYGNTDETGHRAEENRVSWHDFHATVLHLLGIHHERLTFYHNGIQRRLTNVHGHIISDLLA